MIRKQELQQYNKQVYEDLKQKYPTLQLGFFNNNHLLFVGQNPGNPFTDHTQLKTDDVLSQSSFEEFEQKYFEMIYLSRIGTILKKIIGDKWHHISFTNIVKIPTENNEEPSQELVDEFSDVLKKQIKLLNPNLVILLGKFAGKTFGLTEYCQVSKINNISYMMIPHPSYLGRLPDFQSEIQNIQQQINKFLMMNAIIKVTNYSVFYRDISFEKNFFYHNCSQNYCFVKTDEKTPYKSFDGYYLKKVAKEFAMDNTSYERHLNGKDYFYYSNIDNITHSKCIRYMLIDIENDFCNDIKNTTKPVTIIGYYDSFTNKKYLFVLKNNKEQQIRHVDDTVINVYDDEKSMIEDFFIELQKFDLISGWYSNGFDVPYLLNRSLLLGVETPKYFKSLKIVTEPEIKIFQQQFILHDALDFYKRNTYYNKPPAYDLNTVATFLFGAENGKIKHNGVDWLWRNDINKLIEYNIRDVHILKLICDSNNIINYPLQLQQLCPQDFENVFYNSKTIENLLHHRYWKKNIFFPTKIEHVKEDYAGALVIEPIKGLHKNLAVFDFSAMYTNIYLSFNFSPDTLVGEKKHVESNFEEIKQNFILRYPEVEDKFNSMTKEECLKDWILIENNFGSYYFLNSQWKVGILPALEKEMLNYRKLYTSTRDSYVPSAVEYKIYDELQGQAKTILNSIYGVTAFKKFILFNVIVPASITSVARQLNSWVQNVSREKKLQTVYGDTDSIFVKFDEDLEFDNFVEKAKEFNNELNLSFIEFMKNFTSNQDTIQNQLNKIDFEKGYLKLLLTNVKKRYFGYIKYYKGQILDKQKLSVTGFETRRNDTPEFFNSSLLQIYKIFLSDENLTKSLRELYFKIKDDIKQVDITKLIIRIKLSSNLDSYKNIPIHVRALKNSKATIKRGQFVNMLYVKNCEVIHYDENQNIKYQLDYDKYLEKFFIQKVFLINPKINILQSSILEFMT